MIGSLILFSLHSGATIRIAVDRGKAKKFVWLAEPMKSFNLTLGLFEFSLNEYLIFNNECKTHEARYELSCGTNNQSLRIIQHQDCREHPYPYAIYPMT